MCRLRTCRGFSTATIAALLRFKSDDVARYNAANLMGTSPAKLRWRWRTSRLQLSRATIAARVVPGSTPITMKGLLWSKVPRTRHEVFEPVGAFL